MKLYNISNVENLLKVVDQSRGNVFVQFPDNTQCSLKQENSARQLLRMTGIGSGGLCIRLSDPDDSPAFMNFMLNAVS